ncbi:hypothetical protein GCM10022223_21660 [Kineosporia mesophila]|uniref:Uncharacterized protein n=1 Tax=Kineosporia mesophila TaxID=566012 RepID=A0ABP6ZGM4_9ACTN
MTTRRAITSADPVTFHASSADNLITLRPGFTPHTLFTWAIKEQPGGARTVGFRRC